MRSRICSRCPTRRRGSRLATLGLLSLATLAAQTRSTVPFVGCRSEGQIDSIEAPTGKPVTIQASGSIASLLAYYNSGATIGVLAPRGWECLGTYGSSGAMLQVMPRLSRNERQGPIVQLSYESGQGSSSPAVAEILARLFPEYRALARATLTDFDLPVPSGPYPKDKLIYKSERLVEYETPARVDGLGTQGCCLEKSDVPVSGFEMLIGDNPALVSMAVRLPGNSRGLTSTIVRQAERDARK